MITFHVQRVSDDRPPHQPYGDGFTSYDEAIGYLGNLFPFNAIRVEPIPWSTVTITNPVTNEAREYAAWNVYVYRGIGEASPYEKPLHRYLLTAE